MADAAQFSADNILSLDSLGDIRDQYRLKRAMKGLIL